MVAMMKKLAILALAISSSTATAFVPGKSLKSFNGQGSKAVAKQMPSALSKNG